MIIKVKKGSKKKEPIGSLFENVFRPLGLYYFTYYPAMFITFNGLVSWAWVERF